MELHERIQQSQASTFRVDLRLETLLANEREPDAISKLSISERLRFGHYKEARRAYLAINGKLPAARKQ